MGNILVTGGAGYIGSHVLNKLKNKDDNIVVIDNLSTGRRASIIHGHFIEGDLSDTDLVEKIITKYNIDSVMHFAGSIVVPESVTDPAKYYRNNCENSFRLIDLCLKHNVKNFIFSSTAAVYGIPEEGIAHEELPTKPINPYGRTKLIIEWYLQDLSRAGKINYGVLRYFNVAGASADGNLGQCTPEATHLIKIACQTAVGKREKMSIFGDDYDTPDGTCIRDYIHVDDLAQAHLDSLDYLRKNSTSFLANCGYGQGHSVKEVIEVVKKVSGVDFKVEMSPRRDGDPPILRSKADKIKNVLGWTPKHNNLEFIVKTAYEWEKKLKDL